jgi:hypothetical protein
MTNLSIFRRYAPEECGGDGYPFAWHDLAGDPRGRVGGTGVGIKDLVRHAAGERCIRCGHPYVKGESGDWGSVPEPETPEDYPTLFDGLVGMDDLVATRSVKHKRPPLWSPCDERCTHGCLDERGRPTVRTRAADGTGGDWVHPTSELDVGALAGGWRIEVQAAWRILTVHHLTGEKADCRWWNLTSLCQRCHLFIQKQVVMERPWLTEHDEWFKPYAAGFYAWKYEGLDITRDEAEQRLDELLAHERLA